MIKEADSNTLAISKNKASEHRPSSPRKFFARLYGNLDSTEDELRLSSPETAMPIVSSSTMVTHSVTRGSLGVHGFLDGPPRLPLPPLPMTFPFLASSSAPTGSGADALLRPLLAEGSFPAGLSAFRKSNNYFD